MRNIFNITIPFLLVSLLTVHCEPHAFIDTLASVCHVITPRSNGLPSPFSYGIHIFYDISDRNPIRQVTSKVPGIYCWYNMITGKCYVGKSNDMYVRLSNYFQARYLEKHKFSMYICRAILKYGLSNFALIILETNPADLAKAEDHWIKLLNSEYNTERNVIGPGNTTGQLRPDRTGANNSFYGRSHTVSTKEILRAQALARLAPNNPGYSLTILDTLTGISTTYSSIRKGVSAMGWDQANTMRFLRKPTASGLYLKRYKLSVKG